MNKKGLGKGLNSLFNEEDIEEVFWLKTADISHILPKTYASLRPVLEQMQKQDF